MQSIKTEKDLLAFHKSDGTIHIPKGAHFYQKVVSPYHLHIDGDARFDGPVKLAGNLRVAGHLKARLPVEAGGDIRVGSLVRAMAIRAGGVLKCRGDMVVEQWIRAGADIVATGSIRAGGSIFSEGSIASAQAIEGGRYLSARETIRAGWWVFSYDFDVRCRRLKNKRLPLGRPFWAGLPSFEPWRDAILEPANCWNEWRELLNEEQKHALCRETHLHWTLRGQLSNFLGLTQEVSPPTTI